MDPMPEHLKSFMHHLALAYHVLPLLLALLAGLCMLIQTLRKTIDAGQAASFAGLAGAVVLGSALVGHRPAPHGHVPHPPAAGAVAGVPASVEAGVARKDIEMQLEQLTMENEKLRRELRAASAKPAATTIQPPPAPKSPAVAAPLPKPAEAKPVEKKPEAAPVEAPPAPPAQPTPVPATAPARTEFPQ